ncbi:AraC family transcriptional regulator [Vibrio fluvialis]|jgi:hypothetical protein|uniref:AraC family transcriptional regulator n=1 Tax=Vibrio TaxID=662 RepID=UPI001302DFD2|nr:MULTISPECIES: AraC family transcriptional regulator [Vibrio]EKO3464009.1 AraC family transcriptional regulator [Vibrio fluvialis]EKO3505009.1 AraC family transcriptional regulator [Vibrio fluvialis]EKO3953232.1 AraC family transcriptional regulator [Vibrio fluvialis]EKO4000212.1 AraC family transcriptional regulator [Vibrio fluvialis]EKO5150415.1 AraC family transcriptional regulator [Vibrio fluvialis]
MNYAIQSETCLFPYLEATSRKRATKHSLIHVDQGLVLVKLGKQEYAVEPNQAVWIPLDCLCSLTFFPNTQISRIDFSVRLRDTFPHQAGLVQHSALSLAVLDRLRHSKREDEVYPHLLQVLKTEVQNFEPKLRVTPFTQALASWSATQHNGISKEQHLVLLVREAMKRRLSGGKEDAIVTELFAGNHVQYQQMCQLVIGDAQ